MRTHVRKVFSVDTQTITFDPTDDYSSFVNWNKLLQLQGVKHSQCDGGHTFYRFPQISPTNYGSEVMIASRADRFQR